MVVSSRGMAIAAAVQGVGIAFWAEELVRPLIDAGKLVPLLDERCATFPGWFLCYQKQRHTSPAVHAFFDFLRHADAGQTRSGD
ncbi:LysR substrate-binding domain-containing protein [Mesorhizobium sp. Root102]|uniref:LysR substrate-binding domain-containing protein n=1 Tax=Mesorhizobium sp. Root102 TaxID=1736422 RepID=UPI00237998E8|nr:LysR substrate-binding domain-containing protein [Mesorhizobium sp. Root102]